MSFAKKYWYVWVIISIVAIATTIFLVYWFAFKSSTTSTNITTLVVPSFSLVHQEKLLNNLEIIALSYDGTTSQGIYTTRSNVDNTLDTRFFSLSVADKSFTYQSASIADVAQHVLLDSIALLFNESSKLSSTYMFSNGFWINLNIFLQDFFPYRLWKHGTSLFCVGTHFVDEKATYFEIFEWVDNTRWGLRFSSKPLKNNRYIISLDIATKTQDIMFIDNQYGLYIVQKIPSGWFSGELAVYSEVWSNINNSTQQIASMACKEDGTLISLSMSDSNQNRIGTYTIKTKRFTSFLHDTNTVKLVASTSSLSDFRLLSYITGSDVSVYRTNVDNNFEVITGSPGTLQGDPALVFSANSRLAQVSYDGTDIILLAGGTKAVENALTFYVMS